MKKILIVAVLLLLAGGCARDFDSSGNALDEKAGNEDTGKTGQNQNQDSAECEKAGGSIVELEECDGSVSEVCELREGEVCYLENVIDGECRGVFAPKVLCDMGQ